MFRIISLTAFQAEDSSILTKVVNRSPISDLAGSAFGAKRIGLILLWLLGILTLQINPSVAWSQGPTSAAVDAATKAILNEPEFQQSLQALGVAETVPRQGQFGYTSLIGSVNQAFASAATKMILIRTAQRLWNGLEIRLNDEVLKCGFCASKQNELSTFLLFRLDPQGGQIIDNAASSFENGVAQLVSVDNPDTTRWQKLDLAVNQSSSFLVEHCVVNDRTNPGCRLDSFERAAAHEKAWAKCFQENDWVKVPSRRRAYETCMRNTDPMAWSCAPLPAPQHPASACSYSTVRYYDVEPLRGFYYENRWDAALRKDHETNAHVAMANADPNHLEVTGRVNAGEPLHVTLLEPVVVPAARDAIAAIPVRLENPVEALMGTFGGHPDGGIWIKPGATMQMQVKLTTSPDNAGGMIELSLPDAEKPIDYQLDGWPSAGAVIFPAHSSLSFGTVAGNSTQYMSKTELQARYNTRFSYVENGAAPFVTRPILAGSIINVTLQDAIDVKGVLAGKEFHAELSAIMMLPRFTKGRNDAIQLPLGTDVYLKADDQQVANAANFHNALITLDYVVWNGQKVSVHSSHLQMGFQMPRLSPFLSHVAAQNQVDHVLWNAGAHQTFTIVNQVEVPTGATAVALEVSTAPEVAAPPVITPENDQPTVIIKRRSPRGAQPAPTQPAHSASAPLVVQAAPTTLAVQNTSPPQATQSAPALPVEQPAPAALPPTRPTSQQTLAGTYAGRFRCGIAFFDLRLTITEAQPDALTGVFDYSLINTQQRFIYDLAGNEDSSSHQFHLSPTRWETGHPSNYPYIGMKGIWDPSTRQLDGKFSNFFCGSFHLTSSGPPSNAQPTGRAQSVRP